MEKGTIDPETFIKNFEAQFEELTPGAMELATEFRQMPEWTSMQSLIVIASFDWDYGVTVSAEELKGAKTVGDLFEIVKNKAA